MKTVRFKTRHPYGGRYRDKGTVMDMPDKHAMVLITIGKVERYTPPAPKLEKPAEEPKRRGRPPKVEMQPTINSEQPADTIEPTAQEETKTEEKEPEPKEIPANRNTYQTRELKAE